MKRIITIGVISLIAAIVIFSGATPSVFAKDSLDGDKETYLLRYRFQKGDVLRWKVQHQLRVETSIQKTTDVLETDCRSEKLWTVIDVDPEGNAVIEHSVPKVEMLRKQTEKEDASYNSETDKTVPFGFTEIAGNVGVPLSHITLSTSGELKKKQQLVPYLENMFDEKILITLPEEPIVVGEKWKSVNEFPAPNGNGKVTKIRIRQDFTLKSVKSGIATIAFETVILTPLADNPKLEGHLLDRVPKGTLYLDLESGRLLLHHSDVDKRVIGFHGNASYIHQRLRFEEELVESWE